MGCKRWSWVLAVMMLWMGLAATTTVMAETVTHRQSDTPLRLVTHDFPPFAWEEAGEVAGPARALIDRVCAQLEVRCEHRLLPWERAQRRVRQGEADGMYVIGWNRERSSWLNFSTPLLKTEYGVFVAADNPLRFTEAENLRGLRVGVYGPSNTSRSLKALRDQSGVTLRLSEQGDSELLFRQLSAGRLDAVYSNRDVGFALMRDAGIAGIRYAGRHRVLDYYVGFSQQTTDAEWNLRFSRAYQALQAEGVVRDILLSYGLQPAD